MRARSASSLLGPSKTLLEFLFGTSEFLLMKKGEGLVVELQLRLHARIDHFYPAALGRMRRG